MEKEIIKQDIEDLKYIIKIYEKDKKFKKVKECKQELARLKKLYKGGK